MLKQVDLYDSKNLAVEKLSTGMKQRMFIARALINKPQVLFSNSTLLATILLPYGLLILYNQFMNADG